MESGFFEGFERERRRMNSADEAVFEPVGDQATEVDVEAEVAAFVNRPHPAQAPAAASSHSQRSQQQQAAGGMRTPLGEAMGR